MHERAVDNAIAYIEELFRGNAGGHDAAHTMRVYRNALKIAEKEPGCDVETAVLAALLHDADDHKLFATENNANARVFLAANGATEEETERICAVINAISFSKNRDRVPDTLEAKVVQDADRLDAIGAIGIARTFAYGGEHGRSLDESVQHFYDKLLLLKDLMNTEAGKALAEERHAFLEEFLKRYRKEGGL
ncbi:MAG: HD domain-containing protein [Firmicutes bacterium]|nr:HD domain-containing protein [Bacillota bacterium]